jgi:hypothetical protein
MTRKQELQKTISRLVGEAYDAGAQAARDGKSRHHPANPHIHNATLSHVFCIGHMDEVAKMHFAKDAA